MTRFLWALALLLTFRPCLFAAPKPPATPLPLDKFLRARALHGGVVGIEVCDARTGKVLFARNPDTRLLPASNAKLFTAAAALELLGEDYTWTTKVVAAQKPDDQGTVNGDVYLVGAGDASLVSADMDGLAQQMTTAGVKYVAGTVYGDNFLFVDEPYGFGWEWDDFSDEEFPQISALTVNEGDAPFTFTAGAHPGDPVQISGEPFVAFDTVQAITEASGKASDLSISMSVSSSLETHTEPIQVFRDGAFLGAAHVGMARTQIVSVRGALPVGTTVQQNVPVDFPARYASTLLSDALLKLHVATNRVQRRLPRQPLAANAPPEATNVLAAHTSAPLSAYVTHMLKESDNLYAECLVRTVGVQKGTGGSFPAGLAAELPALQKLGVDTTGITLVDGCGVGRRNFVTARAVCQLLVGMKKSPHGKTFYAALPVAGVDGTLKSRMAGTPAQGNCHAKTGTLGAVRALSGYVTGKSGLPYAFSILLNNFPGTARQAGTVQDGIVEWLAAH